ncbi:hypothetical protein OAS39_12235 [Pirellulales bacterium]|nr:hypothetical protein [Pirellulales bacterium]
MKRDSEAAELTPLTQADFDRFHRNAPAALARRGWSGMIEEMSAGLQTAIFGALPVVGLVWLGWSATEMLLFLLVGLWVGILCDTTKLLCLRRRAEAFASACYDDWHVWVVVDALRKGKRAAQGQHLRAKWAPFSGMFVDFFMGGFSTAIILVLLIVEAGMGLHSFQTPGVLWALAVVSLIRIISTVLEIVHHRSKDRARGVDPSEWTELDAARDASSDRPVKAVMGLRGVGLFLLMFLTVFLTDEERVEEVDVAWATMMVVNGIIVLYGMVGLVGWPLLVGETRWLRKYLAERERNPSAELGLLN